MAGDFTLDLSLQVGKYDVQKLLGKGATGTVYQAKDTFSGREVALKTIEPEVFRDPEFGTVYRSQFLNEASLAGKLRHPHIVAILDAVVEEDSGYIAMEIVSGGDLAQFVKPDKLLPVDDVLQIGFKCCGALEYAFAQGIVHRDIKPANIMIVKGTDVKIADFGAAFLRKSQVGADRRDGLAVLHVARADRGQDADAPQRHVFPRRGALRAAHRQAAVRRRYARGAGAQDPQREPGAALQPAQGAAQGHRPRDAASCSARSPSTATPPGASSPSTLSRLGALVLPPGAIPDSEKFVALKRVPMLSGLSDAEIWELARAGKWSRLERAKNIVKEGEPGESFFFVSKGEVKIVRQNRLLNMVNAGEFFGEMAYIWGGELPRHATADAMTDLLIAEFEPAGARAHEPRRAAAARHGADAQRGRPARARQRAPGDGALT